MSAPPITLTERIAADGVLRIFVSSTFRDMHAERDILARRVFPAIRRRCESRGVALVDVDLRWGITSEEAAEGRVLSLCFSEIDRCRPAFVLLLGERYGWIPDSIPDDLMAREPWLEDQRFRGASVTELEAQHGFLRHPEAARYALCFVRTGSAESAAAEDEQARRRLSSLKDAVRRSGCVAREYTSDAAFAAFAAEDLERLIDRVVPRLEYRTEAEREAAAHASYVSGRSRVFIDPPGGFTALEHHVGGNGAPLVLTGPPGSGKSTWLAGWLNWRNTADWAPDRRWWWPGRAQSPVARDAWTWLHVVGATPSSSQWMRLAARFVQDVCVRFGTDIDTADDPARMRAAFSRALLTAGRASRLVVVLDGLDKLDAAGEGDQLAWLPSDLPESIRLIVSAGLGHALDRLRARHWTVCEMPAWQPRDRQRFIATFLSQHGKRLPGSLTTRISTDPQCERLFYLRTLIVELRLTGRFETLAKDLERYLSAQSDDDLVDLVLLRVETDDRETAGSIRRLLVLLRASRGGLSEAELLEAAGTAAGRVPPAVWAHLRATLGDVLLERTGTVTIGNEVWRQAIDRNYLPTAGQQAAAAARLAVLFESAPIDRQIDELPWQYMRTGRVAAMRSLLLSADFLEQAWRRAPHDLQGWWSVAFAQPATQTPTSSELQRLAGRPAHRIAGLLLRRTGRIAEAVSLAETAVSEARRAGGAALDVALNDLALARRVCGKGELALAALREQESLCRDRRDPVALRVCLGNQAVVLKELGENEEALRLLETVADSAREALDEVALASALTNRAELLAPDRPHDAILTLREAEQLFRAVGDRDGLAAALGNLGILEARAKRPEVSRQLHEEEEAIYLALGDRAGAARASARQATLALQGQDFDLALQLARRARANQASLPPALAIQCLTVEASVLYNLGFRDQARRAIDDAARLAGQNPQVETQEFEDLRARLSGGAGRRLTPP